jgi:hypothetical protein
LRISIKKQKRIRLATPAKPHLLAPKDTVKTPDEWGVVYRAITGACSSGVETFIKCKGKLKNKYTLLEILEETKGAYGHEQFKNAVA